MDREELKRRIDDLVKRNIPLKAFGLIEEVREPSPDDIRSIEATFKIGAPPYVDESIKPILTVSGWMSTEGKARGDGLILLADGWELDDFRKNPAYRLMHETPIGVWYEIRQIAGTLDKNGLWGRAAIFDTEDGRDTATLIRGGGLRSFSVAFNIDWKEFDWETLTSHRHWLVEASSVDAAGDIDAEVEEIEVIARRHNIILERSTSVAPQVITRKGGSIMDPETKKQLDEATDLASKAKEQARKAEVTVGSVQTHVDRLERTMKEIADANEQGTKTTSELRSIVDKAQEEFKKGLDDLNRAIGEERNRRTVTMESSMLNAKNMREMVVEEPRFLRATLPESDFTRMQKLQRLNDKVIFVDALLEASSKKHNGNYHEQARGTRMRGLKVFSELNEFARSMDTETSGQGLEWVPSLVSGEFIEQVRAKQVVAPLFNEITMLSQSYTIDMQGDPTLAEYVGEQKTVPSSMDTNEQTPGTAKVTFTARKLRGRYYSSEELNEDAAINLFPILMDEILYSVARAEDKAIINGDTNTTGFDTGDNPGARDCRRYCNGLRYWDAQVGLHVDGGSFDLATFRKPRAKMGLYAMPSQCAVIMSIIGQLMRLLNPNEMPALTPIYSFGNAATILTGNVPTVDGVPVVVSEWVRDDLAANGLYTGAGETRTVMIYVNTRMFRRGLRRGVNVAVEKDILLDGWNVVAFKRGDFQPIGTPSSTHPTVNELINVDTL